jgi:flagellar FliL protein
MAREEKEEKVVEEVPQKKKLPLKKLIILCVAVLVVVAGGVIGTMYYKNAFGKKEQQQQQAPVAAIWPIDPFIVNIQDPGGSDRYLKIMIELDISDKNCIAELNQLKPKLRDNVLDLLSSKSYKDIMDISGKQRLREEIMMRVNSFITSGKILKVYFTDFVVQ